MSSRNQTFNLYRDVKFNNISTSASLSLPSINSTNFPNVENGLAYDIVTNQVFYYNAITGWTPLQNAGGVVGGSFSYSLIKSAPQNISSSLSTQLTNFLSSPVPYHDATSGWNVGTGVFTASSNLTLSILANITWMAGVSNLGNRIVKIMFKPFGDPVIEAKVMETQADANKNATTTQEASITLEMANGDMAWIEVYHNAGIPLTISNGSETSITGTRINL